ncbi:MAG: NERD domain-containing protein, partial [Planctomycetaceae bacterium]
MKRRRNMQLGYDCELAVAQELNALARKGYYVFHDVPADGFNIDHVTVGPTGVVAIETKGRPKPLGKDGRANAKMRFEQGRLQFPGWSERKPLDQATRQAKW